MGRSRCPAAGFGSEGRTGGERAAAVASACNGCGEPAGVATAAPWVGRGWDQGGGRGRRQGWDRG